MQVREEKAPERELVNGERNNTTAAPVIKHRQRQMRQRSLGLLFQLNKAVKVPDQRGKIASEQGRWQSPRETVYQGECVAKGQCEEGRDRQVKRRARSNACELDDRTDDNVAIIVVVDITT